MATCPNKNLDSWKKLVADHGEETAHLLWDKYNGIVPEESQLPQSEKAPTQKDEIYRRSSDDFKLERTRAQQESVRKVRESALVGGNKKIQETLDKILAMSEDYATFLQNNIDRRRKGEPPVDSVSVTNYIGYREYETNADYSEFKHFGIFMHSVVEVLQQDAIETGQRPRLTRERFDELLEDYRERNPFEIPGMDNDTLFEMSESFTGMLSHLYDQKFVVLPEISVSARDADGRLIIGRLDIMVIDRQGKVHVYDFKTKKINRSFNPDTGMVEVHKVYQELRESRSTVNSLNGTSLVFQDVTRTVYDTWTTQLMMYEYMLRQSDMEVGEKKIAGVMYQCDKERHFLGYSTQIFEGNFYEYAAGDAVDADNNLMSAFSEVGTMEYHLIKDKIAGQIPVSEAQREQSEKSESRYAFNLSEDAYNELTRILQSVTNTELKQIGQEIGTHESRGASDEELDLLRKRRDVLLRFEQVLANNGDWTAAMKLKAVMEALDDDAKNLGKGFADLMAAPETEGKARQVQQFFSKSLKFSLLLDTIRTQVEASTSIPKDSNIHDILNGIDVVNRHIAHEFRKYMIPKLVNMLASTYDAHTAAAVAKEKRLQNEPHIRRIDARLDELRNGADPKTPGKIISFFRNMLGYSKSESEQLMASLSSQERQRAAEIQDLELRKLKLQMENSQFLKTDTAGNIVEENGVPLIDLTQVEKYITSVSDPDSLLYIGNTNGKPLLNAFSLSDFIATASHPDFAISGFVNYMKNAVHEAEGAFLNFMQRTDAQKVVDDYMNGQTLEQGNDKLVEVGEESRYNSDGTKETRPVVRLVHVLSQDYMNIFTDHRQQVRLLNQERKALKIRYQVAGATDRPAIGEQIKEVGKKRSALMDEHIRWRTQHTSLPYVQEYYKLMSHLPADIREALEELYFERELIQSAVGYGNEEQFAEEDQDRLNELNIAVRKLRLQAREQDDNYQEYVDALDNLFDYEINYDGFNRVHNRKKLEYQNDPKMLARWEEENMVTVPTDAYSERVEQLFTVIGDILVKNPQMDELYEQQRKILAPYRKDGIVDVRYLSDSDRDVLEAIENAIEELKALTRNAYGLMPEEIDELRAVFSELDSLQRWDLNPYFKKDYEQRFAALKKYRSMLEQTENRVLQLERSGAPSDDIRTAKEDLADAQNQFAAEETDFEAWFNKNCTNKYVSILTGKLLEPVPRSYNFRKVPAKPEHLVRRPSARWNMRRVKESAKNPYYQETADGIPLPVGLQKNGDGSYTILPGHQNNRFINQRYKQLASDPKSYAFYNWLSGMFFEQQQKSFGKTLGYMLPGVAADKVENLVRKGVGTGIRDSFRSMLDEQTKKKSEIDKTTNEYGDLGDRTRFGFNRQLPIDLQSRDAINTIMKWSYESHINQAMDRIRPVADGFVQVLQMELAQLTKQDQTNEQIKRRVAELKNAISLCEYEKRKFISGQYSAQESKKVKKVLNQFFSIISFGRLGFDIMSQVKNLVAGNVQTFLAGYAHEGLGAYTVKDYLWAKGQIYGGKDSFIANYIKDWGKVSGLSLSTMMYRYFNPTQSNLGAKYINNVAAGKARKVGTNLTNVMELAYGAQEKGDSEIAMTTWLAVMHANKYRVKGTDEYLTAYECYTLNEQGELIIRPDVEYTKTDENRLRMKAISETRKAQGNYAKSDQTKIESGILGKLLYFYRKYLVPATQVRFGAARQSWEGGDVAQGWWRAMFDVWKFYGFKAGMSQMLLGGFIPGLAKKLGAGNVNDYYASKSAKASRELMIASMLFLVGLMLRNYVNDLRDDDEEPDMVTGNLIRMYWSVQNETTSLLPAPYIGGMDEYIKSFGSMTSATTDMSRIWKTFEHAGALVAMKMADPNGDPTEHTSAYYSKKTGPFEAGDPKLWKDIQDLTGFKNIRDFFNPEFRLESMRKLQ